MPKGLEVVIGDEGGIRETAPITRTEVAALAYRIHTADVKNEKANLYYDLQAAAFTDLASVEWAKGYIGYAHSAQIVKGNGDGTFNPTGYEVLAKLTDVEVQHHPQGWSDLRETHGVVEVVHAHAVGADPLGKMMVFGVVHVLLSF